MTEMKNIPDAGCGAPDAPLLTVPEAYTRVLEGVRPVVGRERLALRAALGRVLAADVHSPINVPAHTNAAVDGYALRAADLQAGAELKLIGATLAGRPFAGAVVAGTCVRIMTGAPVPDGADTVVMQEHVTERDGRVRVARLPEAGDNVRARGEDLHPGQQVLRAGKKLLPPDLGLLASIGLGEVEVHRRVRVAFFSTGDELRSIGEPLAPGQIYDSNRYTLYGMLTRIGVEILDLGVVRDDRAATRQAFMDAAGMADVVITSGGVSVGEADYVKETLAALGQVNFWQIKMKPGRPLTFGRVRDAVFFGLPGNPVSVMVTFYQFVQPALRRMMGETDVAPALTFKVPCATRLKMKPGRAEFQRGVLARDERGELVVHSTGEQGSGILRSMGEANCFIILPHECTDVTAGTPVEVQPFYGLL